MQRLLSLEWWRELWHTLQDIVKHHVGFTAFDCKKPIFCGVFSSVPAATTNGTWISELLTLELRKKVTVGNITTWREINGGIWWAPHRFTAGAQFDLIPLQTLDQPKRSNTKHYRHFDLNSLPLEPIIIL